MNRNTSSSPEDTGLTRPVIMPANLTREWVASNPPPAEPTSGDIVFDFSATKAIDTIGVSFISEWRRACAASGNKLVVRNIRRSVLGAITAASKRASISGARTIPDPLFLRMGNAAVIAHATVLEALSVMVEMFYWGTFGILKKKDIRKGSLGEQMYALGYRALGIVGLLSFLIGVVLALQAAMQLKTYGAGIFLAPMIGISMIRELGPMLTAIILAGRTGSAITAEIATMVVGEEIDALKTMGINPYQFVVVPKFWAITTTVPALNIFATVMGILGGWFVAVFYLDIASSLYWNQLIENINMDDVMAGLVKSIVFSWQIVWIGAFHGLRVHGGAEEVGRATTDSVVTAIFIIIITDALMSFGF
jgi:phospholipid/cholesterol/gamma-HCH transport system permease protein